MPISEIRAVLFDMGGTLEDIYYDDAMRLKATTGLHAILACHSLDPRMDVPTLYATVSAGFKSYQEWRERTELELPTSRVWTEFIFPDAGMPADRLAEAGEKLSFFYDTNFYLRTLRPEAHQTLDALRQRGYRLGLISNVVSLGQVPNSLEIHGLAPYFETVVTSSALGVRKPSPRIFHEAARLMDLPPAACAYVGDTISRDVIGARRAGYALAIQIKSFLTGVSDHGAADESPDLVVTDLRQVVDAVCAARPIPA